MKQYVTFGQIHHHVIEGIVFDKDCVATFEAEDGDTGREKAFRLFGPRFSFHYTEDNFDLDRQMPYFPRGLIEVPELTLVEELQRLADVSAGAAPAKWPELHATKVLRRAITAIESCNCKQEKTGGE